MVRRIVCVTCLALCAGASAHAAVKHPEPKKKSVTLVSLNNHEVYSLRPDKTGHFSQKVLGGWNRFLRCHHTGRRHQMAATLAKLIYRVSEHFDYRRVFVVAGYRAPKVARKKGNPKSPHKKGTACDFRIDGVANTELRDYLRTLPGVGVGYYPNSNFVHLDVNRKASAFWIDYSGPGERAVYSQNAASDVEAEKIHIGSSLAAESAQAPTPTPEISLGGTEPQGGASPGAEPPKLPRPPAITD